jgi:hypothetical protein
VFEEKNKKMEHGCPLKALGFYDSLKRTLEALRLDLKLLSS